VVWLKCLAARGTRSNRIVTPMSPSFYLIDNFPEDTTKPPVIAFANPKLVSPCVRCRCLPIPVGTAVTCEHMTRLTSAIQCAVIGDLDTPYPQTFRHPPQSQTPLFGTLPFRTPGSCAHCGLVFLDPPNLRTRLSCGRIIYRLAAERNP
jgi:hypothetical protein